MSNINNISSSDIELYSNTQYDAFDNTVIINNPEYEPINWERMLLIVMVIIIIYLYFMYNKQQHLIKAQDEVIDHHIRTYSVEYR